MRFFLLLCLFFILVPLNRVRGQELLTDLSGIINDQSNTGLADVHVYLYNKYRGCRTNNAGIFTLVVQKGDTIIFSKIGYKKSRLILPDTLRYTHLSIEVTLVTDTILIEAVKIFPWKNYQQFKEAFINLKLKEDKDLANAKFNFAIIRAQILVDNSSNPNVNFRNVMNDQFSKTMINGQFPSIPLLNPFNWSKFLESIGNGTFKNSRDLKDIEIDDLKPTDNGPDVRESEKY